MVFRLTKVSCPSLCWPKRVWTIERCSQQHESFSQTALPEIPGFFPRFETTLSPNAQSALDSVMIPTSLCPNQDLVAFSRLLPSASTRGPIEWLVDLGSKWRLPKICVPKWT